MLCTRCGPLALNPDDAPAEHPDSGPAGLQRRWRANRAQPSRGPGIPCPGSVPCHRPHTRRLSRVAGRSQRPTMRWRPGPPQQYGLADGGGPPIQDARGPARMPKAASYGGATSPLAAGIVLPTTFGDGVRATPRARVASRAARTGGRCIGLLGGAVIAALRRTTTSVAVIVTSLLFRMASARIQAATVGKRQRSPYRQQHCADRISHLGLQSARKDLAIAAAKHQVTFPVPWRSPVFHRRVSL